LERLFDLPVLGQFPLVKAKNKKEGVQILQLHDERHALVESYRTLRSALLFRDSPKEHPKSIVITSASPNDGKSMTSANFAITLAQAGGRVLLIDADLRRGVLHKHFFVSSSPGLAESLTGKRHWSKSVVTTPIPNLYLLPCGTPPEHHGNMFAHSGKFFTEIAGQYDYFVFDTAPVLVADDVLSLAPHADGLIMVIRSGFTSARIAHAALNLLRLRRVNVVGLVFNAVHPKAGDYYYDRFKEYYEPPKTA
jgi:succinoglycan biosynthesis transport protein ExoP